MQELNLDVASEFLVMAATLIHIKSRMLLPRPETAAGDPSDEEDPRDALVRRLLEHQKFKAAAELLHERETLRSAQWTRPDARVEAIAGDDYEPELEVDLFSLLSAFKRVLERARERPPVLLPPEQISIEARIEQLLERLSETEACGFEDLFDDVGERAASMIVTFLALLEMIRLKLIRVFQQARSSAPFASTSGRGPQDAPHPIHDPEDEYKAHHPRRPDEPPTDEGERNERREPTESTTTRAIGRDAGRARHGSSDAPRRDGGRRAAVRSRRGDRRGAEAADGAVAAQGDHRGADLRVARAADAEDAVQAAERRAEGRRAGGGRGAAGRTTRARPGCTWPKWPAAIRSPRGPNCTSGCGACSTSGRRRSCRSQSLETLAVIAYKQPITAAEIGEIRGVNTSGVLSTLLERHLIKIVGRKNVIGRPFLYGTTKEFLIRFGLKDLNDLPKIEDMAQQLGLRAAGGADGADVAGGDAAARRGAGAGRRGGGDRVRAVRAEPAPDVEPTEAEDTQKDEEPSREG